MREGERTIRSAGWLTVAARAGHAAKGTIYGATAALALWRGATGAGDAGGAREAVRAIAEAPFGRAAIAILAVGLAAFALSRLALALLDPENGGWRRRARHLAGAAFHAALVVFVAHILFGDVAPAEEPTRLARALGRPRGRWIVSAFGTGLVALGLQRLARPRGDDLREPIGSSGIPGAAASWTAAVGSAARAARATFLLAAGGGLVYAAAIRSPTAGPQWISVVLGCCLVVLAANEWTRARYPLADPIPSPSRPGDQPAGDAHVSDSTGGACV